MEELENLRERGEGGREEERGERERDGKGRKMERGERGRKRGREIQRFETINQHKN